MLRMLAEQSSDHPHHHPRPRPLLLHTPDGAALSEAPAPKQPAVPAAAPAPPPAATPPPPPPPPAVPHRHSASTSASMMRGKYIRKSFSCARSSLVRPLWLANEVWLQLQAFWASEDFRQESSKNKANRTANPTASSTVYRGGSSFVGMHKRKLAELGRPPKQMELFEQCYKKKDDGGWSSPKAAEVAETFQKLMEDHQPQPTADDGPAESEPGHGGPHCPPRGDDGRHDGHDTGDASNLLHCRTVTPHCLQCRPSTASTTSHRPPATHRR
ncbi:UNVERIFIED_CONTAM: hypothetical protein Slati_1744000 [Sesamum latifolium]|uniref:Uncharacterized protein n=1 Tax=Sesamum latifolium TaxID=2727402 RepID=A0AAW2WZF1_9LAMI